MIFSAGKLLAFCGLFAAVQFSAAADDSEWTPERCKWRLSMDESLTSLDCGFYCPPKDEYQAKKCSDFHYTTGDEDGTFEPTIESHQDCISSWVVGYTKGEERGVTVMWNLINLLGTTNDDGPQLALYCQHHCAYRNPNCAYWQYTIRDGGGRKRGDCVLKSLEMLEAAKNMDVDKEDEIDPQFCDPEAIAECKKNGTCNDCLGHTACIWHDPNHVAGFRQCYSDKPQNWCPIPSTTSTTTTAPLAEGGAAQEAEGNPAAVLFLSGGGEDGDVVAGVGFGY